ncbi:MAG: cyanophycinase [Proteobacteria bacterium]|nr:cyanophycinase [Pseudomonadota bacterium]
MPRLFAVLTTSLLACACALPGPALAAKKTYFRVGSAVDATATTTAGTVLMGGSTDVDAAFQWLCARAGGGDFLVVRAAGTDAYNPYVRELCPGLNSVATLIIGSAKAANVPSVRATIADAEVVWIAGGDQSNYITGWTGTPVQQALNEHIAAGRPIGGTSAGLAVLTQFVYSALGSQGITSAEALADPYNKYNTFARDFVFLAHTQGAIGDTHFSARDRMGRTISFLCRIHANGWSAQPRAIAVSEETAVLIDRGRWHGRRTPQCLLHRGAGRAGSLFTGPAFDVSQGRCPSCRRRRQLRRGGLEGQRWHHVHGHGRSRRAEFVAGGRQRLLGVRG